MPKLTEARKKFVEAEKEKTKLFGRQMALKRHKANLKSGYVAACMGIHQSQLSDMEAGRRYWREHHIKAFLKAIGQSTTKPKDKK